MDVELIISLVTLILLEIVLGIDNIIFISILADKLPIEKRKKARIIGLSLALVLRLILLAGISWILKLDKPLVTILTQTFSGKDLILIVGGLKKFLKKRSMDKQPKTLFIILLIKLFFKFCY